MWSQLGAEVLLQAGSIHAELSERCHSLMHVRGGICWMQPACNAYQVLVMELHVLDWICGTDAGGLPAGQLTLRI